MESYCHMLPLVKSNYLTTLIMSYAFDQSTVMPILRMLSQRGNQFIHDNYDQLMHFCKPTRIDLI
jgi:hypothetical protein